MDIDLIFTIGLFLVTIIYILAQNSKKDTKRERYGDAIGELAHMTADSIASTANRILEPKSKKIIRQARENLAFKNGHIYRLGYTEDINKLFEVDEYFAKNLKILGLSPDNWKIMAKDLYYIGVIRINSRNDNDYSKKNKKDTRDMMINDWKQYSCLKNHSQCICDALTHFGIGVDEWIEYGDAVIEMYNLYNTPLIQEFGYISQILPKKNNKHLL